MTDRCNLRCTYCMPAEDVVFADRKTLLSFEEIHRVVSLMVQRFGVNRIRLTGGEPLVRKNLPELVSMISGIKGIEDLAMTTNAVLLPRYAQKLKQAGLKRLNISIDTLDPKVFLSLTRRDQLQATIDGIQAALDVGFDSIKLNALAISGITEYELVDLIEFAAQRGLTMRFIEFMPLDADGRWRHDQVFTSDQILEACQRAFGSVTPVDRGRHAEPAEEYLVGAARIGIIRSVTQPFCESCDRLRLTAEGALRNCLFSNDEVSIREGMRRGSDNDWIAEQIQRCIASKWAGHRIGEEGFQPPERPMYAIGG